MLGRGKGRAGSSSAAAAAAALCTLFTCLAMIVLNQVRDPHELVGPRLLPHCLEGGVIDVRRARGRQKLEVRRRLGFGTEGSAGLAGGGGGVDEPREVEYDKVSGVPPFYNQYLPESSESYRRWKAFKESESKGSGTAAEGGDSAKPKKKKPSEVNRQVVIQAVLRSGKPSTQVSGLDTFGIKLSQAKNAFCKKFACACSLKKIKNGPKEEQIILVQGNWLEQMPGYLIKQFKDDGLCIDDIRQVKGGKKIPVSVDSDD
mmetsp:Transcript_23570/g.41708  ORF Transcript_23570/g.41708 Transcript_23570/m.41708 type:complete len:259 (-) Transcript_23570:82-858(-)